MNNFDEAEMGGGIILSFVIFCLSKHSPKLIHIRLLYDNLSHGIVEESWPLPYFEQLDL